LRYFLSNFENLDERKLKTKLCKNTSLIELPPFNQSNETAWTNAELRDYFVTGKDHTESCIDSFSRHEHCLFASIETKSVFCDEIKAFK
jgi:hypothetical protein